MTTYDQERLRCRRGRFFSVLDRMVMGVAEASSWLYLLIGAIVTYEVIARYIFNHPTQWVEEMSRLGMVWATFLLLAACLNKRQLITITILSKSAGPRLRAVQEAITFLLIAVLAAVVAWYALESMMQTIAVGRRTNTSLSLPYWMFYLPIIAGFALLCLQAVVELVALPLNGPRRYDEFEPEDI